MANEQRLVDANVFIRDLTAMKSVYDAIALDGMIKALKEAHTVDAVPSEAYEQVKWECDVAIEQLESYGVSLGEKADVVKVVRCKDCKGSRKLITSYFCGITGMTMDALDFCSCGERKDNEG